MVRLMNVFWTGSVTESDDGDGVIKVFPVTLRAVFGPLVYRSRCCRLALMLSFVGMKLRVWPPWGAVVPPVSGGRGDPKIFPLSHSYATSSLVLAAGAGTMTNNIRTQDMNVELCSRLEIQIHYVFNLINNLYTTITTYAYQGCKMQYCLLLLFIYI